MKNNKKHRKVTIEDIRRYLNDEMTSAERNDFERKLQSDPILAEAVEGYAAVDMEEATKDVGALKDRIVSRTKRKSTLIYRVAAAIVALLVVSTVVLVKNFRKPDLQIAENMEINKEDSARVPVTDASETEPETIKQIAGVKEQPEELRAERSAIEEYEGQADTMVYNELITEGEQVTEVQDETPEPDKLIAEIPETAKEIEDAERIAGVTARPETMKKAARAEEVIAVQLAAIELSREAHPVVGEDEYLEYLADEQVYPAGYEYLGRVSVSLEIIINDDGSMGGIRVLENPIKEFSDEAMRLVKEGPEWLPSVKNGEAVRDTVNMEIVFKLNDGTEDAEPGYSVTPLYFPSL